METADVQKTEATLSIDASAIKRFREQQSLTQLYVAKMVGVTTDTISRWENNRYPTIKRVNAQRLAEALEVSLEQIVCLLPEEKPVFSQRLLSSKTWLAVALAVLMLGAGVWFWFPHLPPLQAARVLPSYASPDDVIPVQLRFKGLGVHGVVRETLPPGWTLVAAVPAPDSVDVKSGLVRWIVQLEQEPLQIYYLARVSSADALGKMVRFDGELVVHFATGRSRCELLGASRLVISHVHWADLNADYIIDDDEMLDASYLSKNMANLSLNLDAVEDLWIEEHYYWDEQFSRFRSGWPDTSVGADE
ncbi:MAG: helix-turn-helix transcriptional regulator [Thermodesulfobacteriota bacterium]|nr:helix-turn-helix transcriptional regulator [Thermodesulfobacteriota bacterium]